MKKRTGRSKKSPERFAPDRWRTIAPGGESNIAHGWPEARPRIVQDANSVILVCVTVPFIIGVWWKRANRTGALASMAMGFLTWFMAILWAPEFPGDLLGLLVGLVTILVVTPMTQDSDPPVPLRNGDGEEVEFKDRLRTLPLFRRSE